MSTNGNLTPLSYSASSLSLITINTSSQLSYKLTSSNYLSWCATFLTILIRYDLITYLDDTLQCPPTLDANSSTSDVALHAHWNRKDQLLLNAIFASICEAVMSLIAMTTTSCDAWQHLARLFAIKSWARIMQLRKDLTFIQKGSRMVFEFLHAVMMISDELSLIDAPVSDDDLTLYVLNGLGSEFKDMVAPIHMREIALYFAELHDLLIGHEHYLKRMDGQPSSNLVVTANTSQRRSSNPRFKHNKNHFNCFNIASSKRPSAVCQICDHLGHTVKNYVKLQSSSSANYTTSSTLSKGKWLLDFASSYNITSDLANLSIHYEYDVVEFHPFFYLVKDPIMGAVFMSGRCEDCVYPVELCPPLSQANVVTIAGTRASLDRWHHSVTSLTSHAPFEYLYADVWGPSPVPSIDGYRYYVKSISRVMSLLMKASFSAPRPIAPSCPARSPPSPVPLVCMVPLDNPTLTSFVPDATTPVTLSLTPGMASPSSFNHSCSSASPLPIEPVLPTRTHSMALKDLRWRKAMADEFTVLVSHDTWRLIPRPSASNLIGCKWVFRIKHNLDDNNNTFLQHVVNSLGEMFSLKELSDLNYFLEVKVIPVHQGLFLSQNHYIHDLLTRLNMAGAKTVHTPMTMHFGLLLRCQSHPILRVFSDADWGGNLDDQAEYRALATATSDIAWIKYVLDELGLMLREPPLLLCDNVGATQLCLNPVLHSRMKHIAIDLHFVHDFVHRGNLRVAHVHTDDQLADLLTKPLAWSRFTLLHDKINVVDGKSILRDHIRKSP
ncbi:uncharacterized protein [Populus alba]|uniref:uncharacterized protein n=1 Tax=Populus alba TaxID=43335 RepID=UPI003CC733AB